MRTEMRTERNGSADSEMLRRRPRRARRQRGRVVRRWLSGGDSWVMRRNARWIAEARNTPPVYLA
jgi:hypothetical protein